MARKSVCVVAVWIAVLLGSKSQTASAALDITRLSLEELMQIDVYSASRRLEPVLGAASAVFVLTNEDIRRSGARTLPEVLRLVPGVNVARVDASRWAVSIRGFNECITHNLQVLIDGRSIYDPLFAGVFWEEHEPFLPDIERIEVVRGPGGTLWGPNAVNGVINIVTKHARDTQGALAVAGVGTEEHAFGGIRYSWRAADDRYARVYAKAFDRDTGFADGFAAQDDARMGRAGFRWDRGGRDGEEIMLSGDFYEGVAGLNVSPLLAQDVDLRGANLLARWQRRRPAGASTRLQFAYDHSAQDARLVGLDASRDTFDVEWQHSPRPLGAHRLIWGGGYRRSNDDLTTVPPGVVSPRRRNDASTHVYAQDTVTLVPARWHFTFGAKVENTDYSDTQWQPSMRLAWTPNETETWWTAVSRAVRVPARLERDLFGGTGFGDAFGPERVTAYEAGHRRLVSHTAWYDVAAFYNVYDDLRNVEVGQLRNFMRGHTYGAEFAGRWEASSRLRFDVAYTYLQMQLELDLASTAPDIEPDQVEHGSPRQQLVWRALYDPAPDWEVDAMLRFVDELPAHAVASYTELDVRVAWHPRRDLAVALVGQNLLARHHREQVFESPSNGVGTEVQRAIYAKLQVTY